MTKGHVGRTWLVQKNVWLGSRKTTVRLEPDMWTALDSIAAREMCGVGNVVVHIMANKPARATLSSAIRAFVMNYFRAAATEDGHEAAGHGSMIRRFTVLGSSGKKAA